MKGEGDDDDVGLRAFSHPVNYGREIKKIQIEKNNFSWCTVKEMMVKEIFCISPHCFIRLQHAYYILQYNQKIVFNFTPSPLTSIFIMEFIIQKRNKCNGRYYCFCEDMNFVWNNILGRKNSFAHVVLLGVRPWDGGLAINTTLTK